MSSMGSSTRFSHTTKPTRTTAATPKASSVEALPQPFSGASISPYTRATMPTIERTAPPGSTRASSGSLDRGTSTHPATRARTMNGTLTKKTDPYQKWTRSQPLTVGPIAPAAPRKLAQMAMARGRSSGGKTLMRIDSVDGMISAAAPPMTARQAISCHMALDRVANPAATRYRTRPSWRAPLRPYRSPRAPVVNSSPANTSEYTATTHCSWEVVALRSRESTGIATFRLEFPTKMMIRLSTRTASVHQRRSWISSAVDGPRGSVRIAAMQPRVSTSAIGEFSEKCARPGSGRRAVVADREGGGPQVGGAGGEQCLDLAADARLVADDRRLGRSVYASSLEDALVIGQLAVDHELLGGRRSGLRHVVMHGDGQPDDDARLGPAGAGRRLLDARGYVLLDGLGVRHPRDGPRCELAGDPQQPGAEGRHQHRHLDAVGHRDGPGVHVELLAVEAHLLAAQ